MAPRVGVKDPDALPWPLELGLRTPTLWRGPSSGGEGPPLFAVAPQVGVKDSHALPWPLELGLRTPKLWRGPSSTG